MSPNVIPALQSMLLPGIMIIASVLLLLGMNQKYSLIVNRIRLLKEERSRILNAGQSSETESQRLSNIELQISHLVYRISMVRNAVISYSASITLFVVAGILISLKTNPGLNAYYWVMAAFLYSGLLTLLSGIVFAVIEIWKAYRIVRIEISEIHKDIK